MATLLTAVLLACLVSAMSAAEWRLAWSDEFDQDGPPDPSKWSFESGFVRNQELQYYTVGRAENCRVEGGLLTIEGRKEDYPAAEPTARYTSASIHTRAKVSFLFGRIEVRAKLPQGKGVWPAIWTLGTDISEVGWPRCGEIDIMEFVGKEPDRVHATVHYSEDGKHASSGESLQVVRPFDDFHVYAVEWSPQRMDFLLDQKLYRSFEVAHATETDGNPFHRPQYLLLNLALGGSWGGPIDDRVLPQRFLIDYVRYYKR